MPLLSRALVVLGLVACARPDAETPNLLLVMLDDMGQDAVAAYGVSPAPPTTPTLDSLVDEGVHFTRAYAYPVCTASRTAWLTGRYVRRVDQTEADGLGLSERTFAEMAQEAGYATAMFGKWHNSGEEHDEPRDPNRHGFDHFVGLMGNFNDTVEDWSGGLNYRRWERNDNGVLSLSTDYAPSATVDEALDWIGGRGQPWLAFVSLSSAHGPMHVPPNTLHTTDVTDDSPPHELFRAVAEAGDTELGRLLRRLPRRVLDNTVIMVVGDNGTDSTRDAPGFEVLGGKVSVYEGGIRVPLLVTGPPVRQAGAAHHGLVHIIDVLPTLADLMGVDAGDVDGRSLLPFVEEPGQPGTRSVLFNEFFGPAVPPFDLDRRLAISETLKVVDNAHDDTRWITRLGPSPADEVQIDPSDLTSDEAVEVARLEQAIADAMATFPAPGP